MPWAWLKRRSSWSSWNETISTEKEFTVLCFCFCLRLRSRRAKLKFRFSRRFRTVNGRFRVPVFSGTICCRRLLRRLCLRSLISHERAQRTMRYCSCHEIIFFTARDRGEFKISWNLIGSWSGQNFLIWTAFEGRIHRFELFSWMN